MHSAALRFLLVLAAACGSPQPPAARSKMLVAREDPRLSARITSVRPLTGVRAGSGLVARGGRLLVVQDDVPALAVIDPAGTAIDSIPLLGDGAPLPKATKPDFEAALLTGDVIYVLGSGSAAPRRRIARLRGDQIDLIDGVRLHARLRSALGGDANIEGALVRNGRLTLLHRGAGPVPSALLEGPVEALAGGDPGPMKARAIDLGVAAGVPLHFTDATASAGGMIYLAVAEDTPNAIDDGPIRGATIGVVAAGGARYAILREADGAPSVRKAEGIALDPDGRAAWLVTDADDADQPAELCRVELTGPW